MEGKEASLGACFFALWAAIGGGLFPASCLPLQGVPRTDGHAAVLQRVKVVSDAKRSSDFMLAAAFSDTARVVKFA